MDLEELFSEFKSGCFDRLYKLDEKQAKELLKRACKKLCVYEKGKQEICSVCDESFNYDCFYKINKTLICFGCIEFTVTICGRCEFNAIKQLDYKHPKIFLVNLAGDYYNRCFNCLAEESFWLDKDAQDLNKEWADHCLELNHQIQLFDDQIFDFLLDNSDLKMFCPGSRFFEECHAFNRKENHVSTMLDESGELMLIYRIPKEINFREVIQRSNAALFYLKLANPKLPKPLINIILDFFMKVYC